MKFIPDHQVQVASEEAFPTAIREITKTLDAIRESGTFRAFDGINLHYEYFLAEGSTASVVIVHGLSEFTKKFYEFIYHTLQRGYNVFIYDQRCHGLSDRLTDQTDLLHVDNFQDYVRDLAQFIDEVVLKAEDKPLYLYTHSMGGAVGSLYLAQHTDKIQKAVLTAPMYEPIVEQVPVPIARVGVTVARWFCGRKKRFSLTADFNPETPYHAKHGSSRARFENHMNLRRGNPLYQSSPMTLGWVSHSLTVGGKILSRRTIRRITTPIRIISAGNDTMVNNRLQHRFAERSGCEIITIEGASHALLGSDTATVERVLDLTFSFFGNP